MNFPVVLKEIALKMLKMFGTFRRKLLKGRSHSLPGPSAEHHERLNIDIFGGYLTPESLFELGDFLKYYLKHIR